MMDETQKRDFERTVHLRYQQSVERYLAGGISDQEMDDAEQSYQLACMQLKRDTVGDAARHARMGSVVFWVLVVLVVLLFAWLRNP